MDALSRLARRAGTGDQGALGEFVDASYEQVWRLCSSLVDAQSADDLAQETFIRAVRTLPGFRGESSARTWLLAIARHVCLDELRSRMRRRRRDDALALEAGEAALLADASQSPEVSDLLARLEPERRAAFVLTQLLGLSYDEASRICECPPGTIRSRVARARRDLMELVGPVGADRHPENRSPSAK